MIRRLRAQGKGIKTIARELLIDKKTVRKVLKPKLRPREPRPSQLDPFRPLIRALVLNKELSGVRVLEEIRATGYRGGYSVLKEYIRTFRPTLAVQPHLRFETAPGVQGQVDLSPYTVLLGERPAPVVCFSLVLGFSRWQFIRFVLHADAHSVCHSHVLAFDTAGGVPGEILYDRMKQVVLESLKDEVVFHPLFERLSFHYGFRVVPLAPGYKEGKGKVENPFHYVEHNFLAGRTFHDLADLNRQARKWLEEIAWVRIHRTTQEQPKARLDQERPRLIPLPERRFDAAKKEPRQVGDDFCVPWETNRYSVPPRFAGRQAWVRVLEGTLWVEIDGEAVAEHPVQPTRNKRYVLPEHEAEFRQSSTSRHVLEEQFLRLGTLAEAFAQGLRQMRGGAAGYHMSQILLLADRVGVLRVAEAVRHATRYGAFDHQAVRRIVEGKHPPGPPQAPPKPPMLPLCLPEYLRGSGPHQRSLEEYRRLAEATPTPEDRKDDEHGLRRDGPTDGEPQAPAPSPRGPKPR